HKEFIQYLVPAVIALALFFVAMLAGGIILVDDRARGIHEGYFVTPLSALDLVGGLTLSATTLSMLIGTTVLGSAILIARVPLFGILNVVTFFPSGALYPTESYPAWLRGLSAVFPMRYAVHSLRALLLKGVGAQAVAPDFIAMGLFAAIMLVLAATLFKRTL